jgi:HK97 family phage major capsid protein
VGLGYTYDHIVDLVHSVDTSYRDNGRGRFMFHDLTLAKLRKQRDDVGRPLWQAGMAEDAPNTIFGYPYQINNHMEHAQENLKKTIVFGDLSKYMIRDVREITVVRLDEIAALKGQVVFVAWARSDGDLLDAGTHPVKYYQFKS